MTNRAVTNLFIYSPPKTGSTSLFYSLAKHTNLSPSKPKEPQFFSYRFDENNIEKYNSIFETNNKLKFEASTTYLDNKQSIVRIQKHCNNPKFIVVLRDPTDRYISHYKHFRAINTILNNESLKNDFKNSINWQEEWLEKGKHFRGLAKDDHALMENMLRQGVYINHIKNLLSHTRDDHVLIINYNDYKTNFADTIDKICNFLNIENQKIENNHMNGSDWWQEWANVEDEISTEMIAELRGFYKPYNEILERYLDINFGWD